MAGMLFISVDPALTAIARKVRDDMGVECNILEVSVTTETTSEPVLSLGHEMVINNEILMITVEEEMTSEPVFTIDDSIKVIISRGGAVRYLREVFPIPVIEVNIGFLDIMSSINEAILKGGRKIAYLSSTLHQSTNDIFENIGGTDITIRSFAGYSSFRDLKDMESEIIALIERGEIDAVIRDTVTIPAIKRAEIIETVLKSGEDAVRQAFIEAAKVLNSVKIEASRRKELETIINQMNQSMIIVDSKNVIQNCNQAAQRLFSKRQEQMIGENIDTVITWATLQEMHNGEQPNNGGLFEYHGVKLVAKTTPIVIEGHTESSIILVDKLNDIFERELSIRTNVYEKQGLVAHYRFEDIIGISKEIHDLKVRANRYAKSNEIIVIVGETGTGKELFAQSIHNASNYSNGPFVSLNCASLSDPLLESELFGYEEGTFTGGVKGGKKGLFEIAHRGTIFLDEIAKTSLGFQATLLRVLQEKRIRRMGGVSYIPVDVRIICSSNKYLKNEVMKGSFLEDLYYRISVLELEIVPLRERKSDISELARYFITVESDIEKISVWWKDASIFESLTEYEWPGNIRQLDNFIKRMVISLGDGELTRDYLKERLRMEKTFKKDQSITIQVTSSIKEMERQMYEKLFRLYQGDRGKFCKEFNISRSTLWRKLNLAD